MLPGSIFPMAPLNIIKYVLSEFQVVLLMQYKPIDEAPNTYFHAIQGTLDNLRQAQKNTCIMCAVMLDTKV